MIDCFSIVKPSDIGTIEPQMTDLLKHYNALTLEDVKQSVKFYHLYGYEFDIENLKWSKDYLASSSTGELRNKVEEKMLALDPTKQGGLTYFFLMMEVILSLNGKAR
eukprot:8201932-Ditylum_brightwellii.AAC.1